LECWTRNKNDVGGTIPYPLWYLIELYSVMLDFNRGKLHSRQLLTNQASQDGKYGEKYCSTGLCTARVGPSGEIMN